MIATRGALAPVLNQTAPPLSATDMDILAYNRAAWDREVERANPWTRPVSPQQIAEARQGRFQVVLTPTKRVPDEWFPPLAGLPVLCLASGGGQQAPLLAAAGAEVTVLDNSPRQLGQDRQVAEREGLRLETVEGDMADLGRFADGTFALIFHPCSNVFAPAIRPVWNECARVLSSGGRLLAGFTNPVRYLFDEELLDAGSLKVRHAIPYSDLTSLDDADRQRIVDERRPLEFGHSLEDQIGGQLDAGLTLTAMYEDVYPPESGDPLSRYLATFIATQARKG